MGTEWTIESEPYFQDGNVWRSWLTPGAALAQSFLGVTQAVEDIFIDPEDMLLDPELIQTDDSGWTIEAEPD
ncbi:MAG: hypothetical protein ACXABY_05415 [Candidatus Thorarchaeota archaeon]|jgi:hypothetical protein